jgi:hypothetical protein
MKADLYRIMCKKTMYVWFAITLALMLFGLYLSKDGLTRGTIDFVANASLTFFWFIGGTYLLSIVYCDDLKAKTLPSVVGYGNNRASVVMIKLMINVILTMSLLMLAVIAFYLMVTILGVRLDSSDIGAIAKVMMSVAFTGIGFSSVAIVVGYGLQQSTIAIVMFVLLNSNLFVLFIQFMLDRLNLTDLADYLLRPIVTNLLDNTHIVTILPYVAYVTVFTLLTVLIFNHRDLEF